MNAQKALISIVNLYETDASAKLILQHVSKRERGRKEDSVDRLLTICGKDSSRSEVVAALKKLAVYGFGRFVSGRRGRVSRFVWGDF